MKIIRNAIKKEDLDPDADFAENLENNESLSVMLWFDLFKILRNWFGGAGSGLDIRRI